MNLAINREILAAAVAQLNDRCQALLAMRGDATYPGLADEIRELRRDIKTLNGDCAFAQNHHTTLNRWEAELDGFLIEYEDYNDDGE